MIMEGSNRKIGIAKRLDGNRARANHQAKCQNVGSGLPF